MVQVNAMAILLFTEKNASIIFSHKPAIKNDDDIYYDIIKIVTNIHFVFKCWI